MASSTNRIEIQDEEANASFLLGKRDVLLNNYQSACDHLSKTCERIVKLRESDTTPELAEPYFYYGQALLYLGLSEQQVFGSDIVKDADNDENEVIEEENEEEGEGEGEGEGEAENGDDSIPDDDNVNDLERAFEILECAHMIYSKMSETNPQDAFILTRVADIHVMLADICNENGDHENALSHVLKAIEIQETISEQQRYRLLAESCYKLGLIYELINKFPEAVDSFHKAIDAIKKAIEQSQGEDKENEREELKSLLPSIELKLNDAKASIADQHLIAQARKILSGTTNTTDNKPIDIPAKDITLNIRHKRPVTDNNNDDDDGNKKSKIMDFSHLAFELQWEQCFSILDKWQSTMIDHIRDIHQEKTSQIQIYKDLAEKNSLRERNKFILNMDEYFQHDCILSYEINPFKKKLNQLKENIIHRPLPLNIEIESHSFENLISIHPIFTKDLFEKKTIVNEYKIPSESIRLIATSNNQIILINNQSKIFLYDKLIGFIDQIHLLDYTNEDLNDICWSKIYKNFLFLCDYSLWSLENLYLKKLAHIYNRKHPINHLTSLNNSLFLIYNQGEFIDRWKIQPEWKLDKRWIRHEKFDQLKSISSNDDYLLFYTKKSIQLFSEDLIIRYTIDLSQQEHSFSYFVYLSTYEIWLMIDQETHLVHYFHINHRKIQPIDQIFVQAMSLMDDDDGLAMITKENYRLQIILI